MKKSPPQDPSAASATIDEKIASLADWRGAMFAKVRKTILAVDPEIVEEIKWMGTPVWSLGGILCTGETYKAVVKMTFAKGASLADPSGLFNSSLEGNVRRAIDIREGEKLDEAALKKLVRAAIALNLEGKTKARAPAKTPAPKAKASASKTKSASASKPKPASTAKPKAASASKPKAKAGPSKTQATKRAR